MSQKTKNQTPQQEINEMKLRNAFKLMKQERYAAARHVLRELPDHPKAQQMLAFMDGKAEKRKPKAAISKWAVLMFFFVVLTIGGAIVGALLFNQYFSQFSLDDLALMGTNGDMGSFSAVINYCGYSTGFQPNKCLQWPIEVIDGYPEAVDACFAPYSETVYLQDSQINAIRSCLSRYNVPAPY